jgi:hypothetical protein
MRAASIIWSMQIPGLQTFLFRRTWDDLKKNHMIGPQSYRVLLAPLVRSRHCKIIRGEIHFTNGSSIYLRHCQHEADADDYRGAEFHVLLIDELTLFTERMYRMLQSRVRIPEEFKQQFIPPELRPLFPRILCGSNPGGIGHHFVKKHWVDFGEMTEHSEPDEPDDDDEDDAGEAYVPRMRQFIPGKLRDNPSLNPREYKHTLKGLGDKLKIRAMLDGDWTIVAGSMFGEIYNIRRHVCRPFPLGIPADWQIWRGADDGFNCAHCTLWGTQDRDTGTIYVIGEIYGTGLTPEVLAPMITARDKAIRRFDENNRTYENGQTVAGIIDSAAFSDNGVTGIRGPAIAKVTRGDQMNALGTRWRRCRKWTGCRQAGWADIAAKLDTNPRCPDGLPGLVIFDTCTNLIRTIGAALRDDKDPDDIKDPDDHALDALRYLLQWTSSKTVMHDVT